MATDKLDELVVKRLVIGDPEGPHIIATSFECGIGMWFQDRDGGQATPSLGIVLERGKAPYLAFRMQNDDVLPAAITIDFKSGRIVLQEPQLSDRNNRAAYSEIVTTDKTVPGPGVKNKGYREFSADQ